MSTAHVHRLSRKEYLELERIAEFKHEYCRGEIFAISGGTARHSRISVNLLSELNRQLGRQPCQPYNNDLRFGIPADDRYVYPDASIVCGEATFEDGVRDVLLNPIAVFEVLSDSTERYDRGDKFVGYRKLPSLREYVLISQHEPRVECFFLHDDGHWQFADCAGLDATLDLRSVLDCRLKLADLYEGITWHTE